MENPFRRLSKAPTNPVHQSHGARTGLRCPTIPRLSAATEVVKREGLERFEAALQNDRQGRARGFALLFAWPVVTCCAISGTFRRD